MTKRNKKGGWYKHPDEHALASRGIKTMHRVKSNSKIERSGRKSDLVQELIKMNVDFYTFVELRNGNYYGLSVRDIDDIDDIPDEVFELLELDIGDMQGYREVINSYESEYVGNWYDDDGNWLGVDEYRVGKLFFDPKSRWTPSYKYIKNISKYIAMDKKGVDKK